MRLIKLTTAILLSSTITFLITRTGTSNAFATSTSSSTAIKICLSGSQLVGRARCRSGEKILSKSNLAALLGVKGSDGIQGPAGPKGDKGDTGNTGAPGTAGSPGTSALRHYYLTPSSNYDGSTASTACVSGYHMASLWEIFNLSALTYDSTHGGVNADSGKGAPSAQAAWIRTGYGAALNNNSGQGNCNAYTTNGGQVYGSAVSLALTWSAGGTFGPFDVSSRTCASSLPVWCMED